MDTMNEINNIWVIASKEFQDNFKSIRFVLIGILYLVFALPITVLTIWSFRDASASGILSSTINPGQGLLSMLDGLNILLVLLAVVVTADTLSQEKKDRTIFQLLSKPVERSSVILGKYLGCLGMITAFFTIITALSYILTAVLTGIYPSTNDIVTALEILVFIIMLFSAYVSIGVFISTLTRNPLVSILGGVIIWIAFFFMNAFGKVAGSFLLSPDDKLAAMMGMDTFSLYPWYIKAIIWLDPISHDITGSLINGGDSMGLPIWLNLVCVLAYTVIFLIASILIFKYQDLTS